MAFCNPLGGLTVPPDHRNFATKKNLPAYSGKIAVLKKEGAGLVLVYGIGCMCHIAFRAPRMSLWMTLRCGPSRWIASSRIPSIPVRLFFLKEELAGPLVAAEN